MKKSFVICRSAPWLATIFRRKEEEENKATHLLGQCGTALRAYGICLKCKMPENFWHLKPCAVDIHELQCGLACAGFGGLL